MAINTDGAAVALYLVNIRRNTGPGSAEGLLIRFSILQSGLKYSATIRSIVINCTGIHVAKKNESSDFDYPLTFSAAPPAGQSFCCVFVSAPKYVRTYVRTSCNTKINHSSEVQGPQNCT